MPSHSPPPRSNPLRPVAFIGLILLGVAAVVVAVKLTEPKEIIPWQTDLKAAAAESERTGKPRLLYLTASWCGPCREMRRTTWASEEVLAAMERYVPAKVDIDRERELGMLYASEGIPTTVVVDTSGRVVRKVIGYLGPDEMVRWLAR